MNHLAQITNPILPSELQSQSGETFFANFFPTIVSWIFVIGAVIFLFMLLIGAIQWIMSGGDKGALEQAKGRVTNAILGIILLFGSFAIIQLVEVFFGLNIMSIDISSIKLNQTVNPTNTNGGFDWRDNSGTGRNIDPDRDTQIRD